MKLGKSSRTAVVLAAAAAVAVTASGCSNKAPEGGSGEGGGGDAADVQTDTGVDGTTITLGVLTDLTGVFSANGRDITNAQQLYWQDNQVCDTYDVELDIQDTGYVPQQGVQLYAGMKDDVLAMQQTIGSAINAALAADFESDGVVNIPLGFSKTLTQVPGTGVPGATYDVEIANGLDYLFQEGLLQEGDTVGHIYFEGDYGANALEGTTAVAAQKDLTVLEAQIKPTDQDMSAQVAQFKADGVELIILSAAPGQAASVAAAAETQGLDVPILASNPTFAPGLLSGPSGQWLQDHLYQASPASTFAEHPDLAQQYQAEYPEAQLSQAILFGFGMAAIMNEVLDAACDQGDLTRQGVFDAFTTLEDIDTDGVLAPLEGFSTGQSPSLQNVILRPADVPGGLEEQTEDAFQGEFAEGLARG